MTNKPKNENETNCMIGRWFHSVVNGDINWQGRIIGMVQPGLYLVQLYECAMGEPSIQRLVNISDMTDWLFYSNSESMIYSLNYGSAAAMILRADAREIAKQKQDIPQAEVTICKPKKTSYPTMTAGDILAMDQQTKGNE